MRKVIIVVFLLAMWASSFGASSALIVLEEAAVTDVESVGGGVLIEVEARGAVVKALCPIGQLARHCGILEVGDVVSVVAQLATVDADDPTPVVAELSIKDNGTIRKSQEPR